MALYLVQHGKSRSKEEDPEQSLSPEGEAETRRIAEVARGYAVSVEKIFHSVKKRARQTAEIFSGALSPPSGIQEKEGLKALDDVRAAAESIDNEGNTMLVGHLPFMSRLTSFLITENEELPVLAFQNSGIVCLDKTENGQWQIKWTLMPHIA